MNSWTRRRMLRAALAAGSATLLPWRALAQQKTSALLRAPRRALVIGNSAYKVSPLKNPANDARAMAEALKLMGFDVALALDLPRDAMLNAAREYTDALSSRKPVGLFYFAGHGMQLAWRNYLLPVDAVVGSVDEVQKRCLDVNTVIEGIARAANPMNLIVLDACRENPFGRDFRVEQKGLSQLDAPAGTFLAYATSPGNVASDGAGSNGLYTEHLLREMRVPEAKIEDVFKRVRLAVRRNSNGAQVPWESTSLEDDFWFIPPKELKKLSEEEAEREFKKEAALWERAEMAREKAALEEYLWRYPSGNFSELAQVNLDELLAALGERKAEVVATAGNPYSKGFARADTEYKVGDFYSYTLADQISKVVQSTTTHTVARVNARQVVYDSGLVTDRLGNVLRARGARNITGNQQFPAEFQLGRQWSTRFTGDNLNIGQFTIELALRITARETIKVGAGSFDTFRIEGTGARYGGKQVLQIRSKTWFAPDKVRRFVLREEIRTGGRGRYSMAERTELTAFKQA
jgi:uncharacterized caspase-like protein